MSSEAAVAPGAEGEGGVTGPEAATAADWRRLDRRTVLVGALVMAGVAAGAAVPATLGLSGRFGFGHAVAWVLAGAIVLIGCAAVATTYGGAAPVTASAPNGSSSTPGCCWSRSAHWPGHASAASTSPPICCNGSSAWSPSASAPASTPATNPPWNSTRSPGPRANGSAASCWNVQSPAPRAPIARASSPPSTRAGSATHRLPSSPPRSAVRRPVR